jgi:hypothetical protein
MPIIRDTPEMRAVLRDWAEDTRDQSWAERAHEAYVSTRMDVNGRSLVRVDDQMLRELQRRIKIENEQGELYTRLPRTGTGSDPSRYRGMDHEAVVHEVAQEFVGRRGVEALRELMRRAVEARRGDDDLSEKAWRDIYTAAKAIIAARTTTRHTQRLRGESFRP